MASYGFGFTKTGADSVLAHVELLADATTPRRIKLYSFGIGCTAASNDGVHPFCVRRITNSGTGTAVTPAPLDPADAAALMDAEHLITVDPASYAAGTQLYLEPLNGRASWQWNANPGREFVGPATATNGFGIGVTAASTSTYAGNVQAEEQ
jgi:hypothetical protein